jgi:hypothetical protein
MDGGAVGFGGESAAVGFGEAGLSQDEKKSSSSPAGCAEVLEVSTPSMTMPFGNLCGVVHGKQGLAKVRARKGSLSCIFFDAAREFFFIKFGHATCVFPFDIGVIE